MMVLLAVGWVLGSMLLGYGLEMRSGMLMSPGIACLVGVFLLGVKYFA